MNKKMPPTIFYKQLEHLIATVVLLGAVFFIFQHYFFAVDNLIKISFYIALLIPVLHQIYVWIIWRLQLNNKNSKPVLNFKVYVVLFFILFLSRFISLLYLAWIDQGSLKLNGVFQISITAVCLALGLYAMYSVKRYFGMKRASGADHFDKSYRSMPLVKKGIFRFTNNGMYLYAFLNFWAIAIGFNSVLALIVAGFSHAYIWVHFYCTEKPDMDFIYGKS